MKVHGCTSCGARFPTYAGLQEHLLTHRTVCRTCNRAFTRRDKLLTHKCVTADHHSCESCRRTFSTRRKLKRHLRETSCSQPLPPEPKRQRVAAREEDPDDLTEPPSQQDPDLQDVLTQHWSSIRSHVARGPIQTRYNYRLENNNTRTLDLRQIFREQTTACKVNLSYGFILYHKISGRFKYYHSSCNCCGRYLDKPRLVTNVETFEAFLERIHEQDILQWAIAQRPNSDWICSSVTNVTFFANKILQHPIGCVGVSLPTYVKLNKAIVGLEKGNHSKPYLDNLCLFRCLGLHLGRDAMDVYAEYTDQPARQFRGVTIEELHKVELVFRVNITVYELGDVSAKLVRRSLGKHADTVFVNLYKAHFSYIRDMKKFSHSYMCRKCGETLWRYPSKLKIHESACEGGIRRVYKGGVYHPTPSVFQRLEDEGIHVVDDLRYYPYRATFDFECFFDGKNLPNATDHVEWVARHVPLSGVWHRTCRDTKHPAALSPTVIRTSWWHK